MEQSELAAELRVIKGKGAARNIRNQGQIPAVFYGPKTTSTTMLTVNCHELEHIMKKSKSGHVLFDLQIKYDKGSETKKAMLKELQVDPLDGTYLHADFYEVSMDREITANIPIHLTGTPIGVTKGGILQAIRRELEIACLPGDLIDSLDVNISNLDIGDSLHIRDIELPEGISSKEEGHLTIAVVAAPTVAESEIEEEAEEETLEAESEGVEEQ